MRGAFVRTLAELAAEDRRIMLLTGDLGFMALEPFAEKFPDRFINMGVAEQNMVGVATGLAREGFLPFVYSIVTFASLRPYEFIRNGPILHNLPVRIVGIGGGFEYGHAGLTHHGLEDVGVMRVQPGIALIAPADHEQTRSALQATWDLPGPVYYRLGKNDTITVPGLDGRFDLGRVQVINEGDDLLLIAMGAIASEAAAAARLLATRGIASTLAVVSSLNPAPVDDLVALLARFRLAMTVEEHYVVGGLGSLVAETVADHGLGCRVLRCGVRSAPNGVTGGQAYLQQVHGLSRGALVDAATALVTKSMAVEAS
ncbi:MAG: 1-deoxy-D-xylulose-5-phosphate synthase [Bacteroidetes bacterium]|nr:1-deoxy-D-xylulose-5-phosphate synthase [Bacteroidota bacterium]MCL5026736.1 1-deoxy-D-xylulose-5-phosphate synthase [Chloroflexota bacterium]